MKRIQVLLLILLSAVCPAIGCAADDSTVRACLLMAHYMPWFEADPAHARWGWHWSMNHYVPDRVTNGRREAASHYYPLIGLYDSNDPDAIECQVLLMKYAGIDGLIIDWHGTDDYLDYGLVHRNTIRIIEAVKRAGLRFAICYEDQSVPNLIAGKRIAADAAVPHGETLLRWLQANWFADSAYLKQGDRPVFLVFGSGYYQTDQLNRIFAGLSPRPLLFTEASRRLPAAGAFDWPHPAGGTDKSFQEMDRFYSAAGGWPQFIAAAFPRFHDIYQEAGVQKSWGKIEDRDGKTYEETLERALKSGAAIVQLVTWNDWGEGTQIEPSIEYGYRDLETTQRLRRKIVEASFSYGAQELRLPVELYNLRKRYAAAAATQAKLDEASRLLFAGSAKRAAALLHAVAK